MAIIIDVTNTHRLENHRENRRPILTTASACCCHHGPVCTLLNDTANFPVPGMEANKMIDRDGMRTGEAQFHPFNLSKPYNKCHTINTIEDSRTSRLDDDAYPQRTSLYVGARSLST